MTVKTGCDVSVCLQYKEQQMLKLVRAGIGIYRVVEKVQTGILLVKLLVVECGVSYCYCKYFYQRLLSAVANFLRLSYNDLVAVSNEIPLSMLLRSRERLNQRQSTQDYLLC